MARMNGKNPNIKLTFRFFEIKSLFSMITVSRCRSILVQVKVRTFPVRDVIPFMLVKEADICLTKNARISLATEALVFISISRVQRLSKSCLSELL